MSLWLVSELRARERSALLRHFLSLPPEDRRLRFGGPLADMALSRYVDRLDFERDAVFGVYDDELRLCGVAHVARATRHAELGISVLQERRNHGIGSALLERATLRARNWRVRALFMHCLKENRAIMHLARKQDMDLVTEAGEADGWLRLSAPDAATLMGEAFAQNAALFDYTLKRHVATTLSLQTTMAWGALKPNWT